MTLELPADLVQKRGTLKRILRITDTPRPSLKPTFVDCTGELPLLK